MTIYMKDGVAAHVDGILRTEDQFEPYTGEKPVLMADLRRTDGMICIYQRAKDDSKVTRLAINKDNVLFIDFENEVDGIDYRPSIAVWRNK